jgi:hypothetical protein
MKSTSTIGAAFALAFLGALAGLPAQAQSQMVTPAQWLAAQPKPAFKPGHTLPRLTRFGYDSPFDIAREKALAEHWGYAVELHSGYLDPGVVARLDNPNSREAKMAALNRSNPTKYPLSITTSRRVPKIDEPGVPNNAWTRNASGQVLTGQATSADGNVWTPGEEPVFSTEAPNSVWTLAGKYRADPLRALVARGVPVNIVLNAGEYGMSHIGADPRDGVGHLWSQDPAHNAAVANSIWGGGRYGHSSAKKANAERIIADAIRAAAPQRSLYVYYTAGGRPLRNKFAVQDSYGGYWEHVRGISDKPSNEVYFKHYNDGFTGRLDVLTIALNAASMEIATGDGLSYNWITAGWARGDPASKIADVNRWTGFLKCYFTAGMIGANVGSYDEVNIPSGTFPSNSPSPHLRELVATSHVQALFSQVEDIVRNGDLLAGPGFHSLSPNMPAYEFPTGDDTARVLARKHRTKATWLVTAWAASGADRNVSVYIPEIGQLTVQARAVGSVYTATLSNGNVTLIRLDNEGATYTRVANGAPVVKPVNPTIPPPIALDRLLWLTADAGVTADASGKVSSWAGQGGGVTVTQTNASRRPTRVANAISGKPALRFVNGQTWLENLNLGATGNNYSGSLTIISVFTGAQPNSDQRVLAGIAAGGTDYLASGFNLNNSARLEDVRDGVILKVVSASINAPLQKLVIGDAVGNTGPGIGKGLTGDIGEVLIYEKLSKLEEAQITNYLRSKYSTTPNTVIVNGSFEDHSVKGYQYAQYTPQSGGWIHARNAIVQTNGSAFGAASAPNGFQTGVLQGFVNDLGSMSQTVDFAAGAYVLSFKAARRDLDAGRTQPIKVSINGTQIGDLITPPSIAFTDYTTASFKVPAGLHTIRLEATDGTSFGNSTFIDQVALRKVLDCNLDANGDGRVAADADALLISRRLFGYVGGALINNVPLGASRPNLTAVESYFADTAQFDVFGRPVPNPNGLTDGLVLLRLMRGVPDQSLLSGITIPANSRHQSAGAVRANVNQRCGTAF